MDFQQRRLKELNALYIDHESHIDSVQAGLKRELPLLVQEFQLSLDQTTALDDYVNDRGTFSSIVSLLFKSNSLVIINKLYYFYPSYNIPFSSEK